MREGWKSATLGDVLALIRNGTNCDQAKNGNGFKISRIETISSGVVNPHKVGYAVLSDAQKANFNLRVNDILFSHINSPVHVGKVAIITRDDHIYHGINLLLLRPTKDIEPTYLYYYLNGIFKDGYWRAVCKQSVNQASVNQADIKKVPIIYPKSISEQKRIVAILDESFEGIDMAIANAEANLANARELFDSYRDTFFERAEHGWTQTTLGKVCKFHGGSQPPKSLFSADKGPDKTRLIQIRDYKSDRHVVYIPTAQARRFCDESDVMIGRYGPPLFQILRGLKGAYNVALIRAAPNEKILSKDYLFQFLKNRRILRYIIHSSNRAAGQIGLNKGTIEPYPIAIPTLDDQAIIVNKLEDLAKQQAALERVYESKINALDELKQSILQNAFAGQLTKRPVTQEAAE